MEPVGALDRPPVRARPGRLEPLPPQQPWPASAPRSTPGPPGHRVSGAARRRHALGYLEPAVLERLEALETELEYPAPPGEP